MREMTIQNWNRVFADNVKEIAVTRGMPLFVTDADRDVLWNLYLDSFPAGANEIYRTNRKYDCSACRHFVKQLGPVVYVGEDLRIHSLFSMETGDEVFQPVMDALASYVESRSITGRFFAAKSEIGREVTYALDENGKITRSVAWNHFHLSVPESLRVEASDYDTAIGDARTAREVFRSSLETISVSAAESVLELIRAGQLYRGAEWKGLVEAFLACRRTWETLSWKEKEVYSWRESAAAGGALCRIKNTAVGSLLTAVSEGTALEAAVRAYERVMDPGSYRRSAGTFSVDMLKAAEEKVRELGLMESLPRRFATLDDISVGNILFSNRDAAKRIAGSVFESMAAEASEKPRNFDRVETIPVEKFVKDVLPDARELEIWPELRHRRRLVSLIAPVNREAPGMFKWDNAFSWAYTGNITDASIRENVKAAGGSVTGVLRFSIQWNDTGAYSGNDLDAHCRFPGGHIYYRNKSTPDGGCLDVDIIHPVTGRAAVENITWPVRERMKPGTYQFFVHQFTNRGGRDGFRAEIECGGKAVRFNFTRELRQDEIVPVADVVLEKDGTFRLIPKLPVSEDPAQMWGVKTESFVPASVVMYSPNYWDAQTGIGNRHYFFMLKGCVNPENPNGFYNEYLRHDLMEHRQVLEKLGAKMAVAFAEDQLSGLGFSDTSRDTLTVRVTGATRRVMKVSF